MEKYDYLIVGAGLFGTTFAREMTNAGKNVLILDKRPHIAGNCYTENIKGINVHKYGPHIFHTSNEEVWKYVNRFATFNHFVNRVKARCDDKIYSLPINLMTLYQLWGTSTPQEAQNKLNEVKIPCNNPANLEEWCLSQVGQEVYELFIKGYTTKQWGQDPKDLPSSIIRRLPIRLTFDDNYYNDIYQGIPIGGYTKMVENMLHGIKVELSTDFNQSLHNTWTKYAKRLIYTGPIDQFFDYSSGKLAYRSLTFVEETHNISNFQGNAQINYTNKEVPWTRIIEHKHFEFGRQDSTIITKEYPAALCETNIPYYPVHDEYSKCIYEQYASHAKKLNNVVFAGRLGSNRYFDMDQTIASALTISRKELI